MVRRKKLTLTIGIVSVFTGTVIAAFGLSSVGTPLWMTTFSTIVAFVMGIGVVLLIFWLRK